MFSTRNTILNLIDQGHLPPEHAEEAMRVAGVFPNEREWAKFIGRLLLWLGVLGTVLGVVFFVAFNWDAMGKMGKFSLVQTLLVLSLLPLLWRDRSTLIGKLSLLGASVVTGALLALFGQTYQTGADTWQLFATWALLIVPWVWLGRFEVLWLVWIGIVDVALLLYCSLFKVSFWSILFGEIGTALVVLIFNGIATIVWEYTLHHRSMNGRNGVRIVAMTTAIAATFVGAFAILDYRGGSGIWWVVWLAWLGVHCMFYRQKVRDLFMLSGGCLSAIIIIMTLMGKFLIANYLGAGGFFLMAILLLGAGSGAAAWLRDTAQSWEENHG
jgi:uncharacterized membrane protein